MTNTDRIENFKKDLQKKTWRDDARMYLVEDILKDNLPKQISREAVKELREKYVESMNDFKDMYDNWNGTVYWVWKTYERVIKDLDFLLSKQQDDTN